MFPELFVTPTAYFEERVKYPKLKVQFVIVVLVGLIANLWRVRVIQQLGAAASYVEDILYIFVMVGIAEFILWWLILTFIMHVLAIFLGGDSSYGDLLRLTGFGFWPMIIMGAVFSGGWILALRDAPPPEAPPRVPSFRQRFQVYNEWLVDTANVYTDPVLLASLLIGSLFVIGAGILWIRAVQVVTGLDEPRAAIAAGVPVLILLFRIFQPIMSASAETAFAL